MAGLIAALVGFGPALPSAARAAGLEIVDVRVGRHPDKARLVLDGTEGGSLRPVVTADGLAVQVPFPAVNWRTDESRPLDQVEFLSEYRFRPDADGGGVLEVRATEPVRLVGAVVLAPLRSGEPVRYVLDLAPVRPPAAPERSSPTADGTDPRGGAPESASAATGAGGAASAAVAEPETAAPTALAPQPRRKPEPPGPLVAVPEPPVDGPPIPRRKPRPDGGDGGATAQRPALPPVPENPAALAPAVLAERIAALEQAALLGDIAAMRQLGALALELPAENDQGGPEVAFAWFRKAAQVGDADAAFRVAQMYRTAEGVPRSDALAAYWYGKAAEQGLAPAQINLGILKLRGLGYGVLPDSGADLLRKAAEQGSERAGAILRQLDEAGGVLPDDVAFVP